MANIKMFFEIETNIGNVFVVETSNNAGILFHCVTDGTSHSWRFLIDDFDGDLLGKWIRISKYKHSSSTGYISVDVEEYTIVELPPLQSKGALLDIPMKNGY